MKMKYIVLPLIVIFFAFGAYRASDIFLGSPVTLSLGHPSSVRMSVIGTAKHQKEILINGERMLINQKGEFTYDFSPTPGPNVVTVHTKDIFGNSKEKVYSFVYAHSDENLNSQLGQADQKTALHY